MIILFVSSTKVITDIAESVVAIDVFQEVTKDGQVAYRYMANSDISTAEVSVIPEGVQPLAYLYVDGAFVKNPDYVPYISPEKEFASLESIQAQVVLALVTGGLM